MTNGMYPELITRPDIKIFLPPIGGLTVYIWGDPATIPDEDIELTCRVHDECNGSDVFGSDICTCRPYLTHAIEECIKTAQRGGCGIVIYYRKEGRSLGEVTKYLVYNTRKRQEGGDSADRYFSCTEQVAGVQDTRFQTLMPDPLHFLGVTKIHNFISMSDMKYNAITSTGIQIVNRVEIPPEMVPVRSKNEHNSIFQKGMHGSTHNQNLLLFFFCRRMPKWKSRPKSFMATTQGMHTRTLTNKNSKRPRVGNMDTIRKQAVVQNKDETKETHRTSNRLATVNHQIMIIYIIEFAIRTIRSLGSFKLLVDRLVNIGTTFAESIAYQKAK
jgi:GTP cyclohydrolase II